MEVAQILVKMVVEAKAVKIEEVVKVVARDG